MPDGSAQLYSARPTLRIDGQQNDRIDAQTIEMTMREQLGGLSSLEVKLLDSVSQQDGTEAFGFGDGAALKLGAELKLYAGVTSTPQEIFRGRISALEVDVGLEGPPSFAVLAEDALQKARKNRVRATYEDSSPADVVRTVAGRLGLAVQVADGLDTPSATWVQMNESDLAFLRRLLDRFDADMQMVGDTLQ